MKTNIKLGALFILAIFILAITAPGMAGARSRIDGLADKDSGYGEHAELVKAIRDYLTGKSDKLPPYNEYKSSGENNIKPTYREATRPFIYNDTYSRGNVSSMSISTTPTRVYDPHWSNTYIGFGNKDGGPRAWFVDGVVDWLYDLENNGKEEFVMHQWGDDDAENCIQMTRYDNTITFTIYSKAFAYPWIDCTRIM